MASWLQTSQTKEKASIRSRPFGTDAGLFFSGSSLRDYPLTDLPIQHTYGTAVTAPQARRSGAADMSEPCQKSHLLVQGEDDYSLVSLSAYVCMHARNFPPGKLSDDRLQAGAAFLDERLSDVFDQLPTNAGVPVCEQVLFSRDKDSLESNHDQVLDYVCPHLSRAAALEFSLELRDSRTYGCLCLALSLRVHGTLPTSQEARKLRSLVPSQTQVASALHRTNGTGAGLSPNGPSRQRMPSDRSAQLHSEHPAGPTVCYG